MFKPTTKENFQNEGAQIILKTPADYLNLIQSSTVETLDRNNALFEINNNFEAIGFSQEQLFNLRVLIVEIYQTREAPRLLDKLLVKVDNELIIKEAMTTYLKRNRSELI
jgi:hypothetical protein